MEVPEQVMEMEEKMDNKEEVLEALDVVQVVNHMATKPNVKEELDLLISQGRVKNVEATRTELKRLGHYVG